MWHTRVMYVHIDCEINAAVGNLDREVPDISHFGVENTREGILKGAVIWNPATSYDGIIFVSDFV